MPGAFDHGLIHERALAVVVEKSAHARDALQNRRASSTPASCRALAHLRSAPLSRATRDLLPSGSIPQLHVPPT